MNANNHTEAQAIHSAASAAPAVLLKAADPSKNLILVPLSRLVSRPTGRNGQVSASHRAVSAVVTTNRPGAPAHLAIHRGERATGFHERGGLACLETEFGRYRARRLVVTAGPWLPSLLGGTWAGRFTVRRQALFWFRGKDAIAPFEPERFPVFIWELAGRDQPIYGFPAIEGRAGGVKIASEQHALATTPEEMARKVAPAEARALYEEKVAPCFPGLSGECVKAVACLYTMTADCHFVIEPHPDFPSITIASPCSGHGFKHSAAIGERLALSVDES